MTSSLWSAAKGLFSALKCQTAKTTEGSLHSDELLDLSSHCSNSKISCTYVAPLLNIWLYPKNWQISNCVCFRNNRVKEKSFDSCVEHKGVQAVENTFTFVNAFYERENSWILPELMSTFPTYVMWCCVGKRLFWYCSIRCLEPSSMKFYRHYNELLCDEAMI